MSGPRAGMFQIHSLQIKHAQKKPKHPKASHLYYNSKNDSLSSRRTFSDCNVVKQVILHARIDEGERRPNEQ